MNWTVSIMIYSKGLGTLVEISNATKEEIAITKNAEKALRDLPVPGDYDNSKEGKRFEKQIFHRLLYYMNRKLWKGLISANFWAEKGKIIFDTGS